MNGPVRFCSRCVVSSRRPGPSLSFDANGVCDDCRAHEARSARCRAETREFSRLLDGFRSKDGSYDCILCGAAQEDLAYAAWQMKYRFAMHPLLLSWSPCLFTDAGLRKFRSCTNLFDSYLFSPNGKVHRQLAAFALENLFDPFQPLEAGLEHFSSKIAVQYRIPLIFDVASGIREFIPGNFSGERTLAGLNVEELVSQRGMARFDLEAYLPADEPESGDFGVQRHDIRGFLHWTARECAAFVIEKCGFVPEDTAGLPFPPLNDVLEALQYHMLYLRCGLGRASFETSRLIRENALTRQQAQELVKQFDEEFPAQMLAESLEYLGMSRERFSELVENVRKERR